MKTTWRRTWVALIIVAASPLVAAAGWGPCCATRRPWTTTTKTCGSFSRPEKAGVVLPRDIASKEANSFAVQLYKSNDLACQLFQTNLANNKAAREYLAARGLGEAAIKKFRIGYAPDAWEALINFFKAKGVTAAVLEKAGLVVANERGGHYDRFRNRITFPIVDLKDRILGFGARVLDAGLPKYINSPETIIYSKGRNLYGLNVSKEAIKKEKYALVVATPPRHGRRRR